MRFAGPVLVVFHGSVGERPAERMVAAARVEAVGVSAQEAVAGGFEAVVVVTDVPEVFAGTPGIVVDADIVGRRFDYLGRLQGVVREYGLERPVVMGSGSLPLMRADDFRRVVDELGAGDGRCVTNNFFSADLTAWAPASAIDAVTDAPRDNMLPRRLRDEGGLASVVLPRTTATQFDIDTPVDLAILGLVEGVDSRITAGCAGLEAVQERLRALMLLFCDREAEVVIAGRVGSQAWQYMELETACRVRLFSEERGLAAAGREHTAKSALGFLIEAVGVDGFFARMGELGDGLVLDTRVLEAHFGVSPTREDRFQSDLLNPEGVEEPFLRELTRAARESEGLVVLGGHSLVSGGLMALNDQAWREEDRRKASSR